MLLRGILRIGLPLSVLLFAGAAALLTAFDLPAPLLPWIAALPLLLGAYAAARYAARRRRLHGWQTGLCAGLLLTGLWYPAACLLSGRLCVPAVLPAAAVCGMLGGMRGVCLDAPAIHARPHRLIGLRERLTLHAAFARAAVRRPNRPKAR